MMTIEPPAVERRCYAHPTEAAKARAVEMIGGVEP